MRRVIIAADDASKKQKRSDAEQLGVLYALADGKRHGVGKRVWASGAWYVSCLFSLVWRPVTPSPSLPRYEGQWVGDTMHGSGVYMSAKLTDCRYRYEGNFVEGRFDGQGKAVYGNWESGTYVCPLGSRHVRGRFRWPSLL
jgi:hypothetical protein